MTFPKLFLSLLAHKIEFWPYDISHPFFKDSAVPPPPPNFPEPNFQNYDLPPPPPDALVDRQSLSSNSVNEFPDPLPPPPQEKLQNFEKMSDFEAKILNLKKEFSDSGMIHRKQSDPSWAPLEYIEKVFQIFISNLTLFR